MLHAINRLIPVTLKERLSATLEWYGLPAAARREIAADRAGRLFPDPGPAQAIRLMADWLLAAQASSSTTDGGYARHFSIVTGWGQSYPETTGYIIPTLIEVSKLLGDPRYEDSARHALNWCKAIQFPSGAFQGGIIKADPLVPVTFNTGQILLGLAAGVRHFDDYRSEAQRAADWLVATMDADGCWRRFPTPFAKPGEKTYETQIGRAHV